MAHIQPADHSLDKPLHLEMQSDEKVKHYEKATKLWEQKQSITLQM